MSATLHERARASAARAIALVMSAWFLACSSAPAATPAAESDLGESIYRGGLLDSGKPLRALSDTGVVLQGAAVACANCHRRSGLGAREGGSTVPPITGRYLFRSPMTRNEGSPLPFVEGLRNRSAYDDATLARAIREGIDADGRALKPLMPHFDLDDAQMAALVGYLKRLDRRRTPGITETELHLATIVTPDADPVARSGMLAVLRQFVADANAVHFAPNPGLQPSGRTMYAKSMFRAHRQWTLHVWQLEGAPRTWGAQLEKFLVAEPVFAVLSGLGGADWTPVHEFCEKAALPCLFPNVEAPPRAADRGFYSTYFSQGVLLEARLFAGAIAGKAAGAVRPRVVQVYISGDSGEAAAQALDAELAREGMSSVHHTLAREAGPEARLESLGSALRGLDDAGTVVLWLRPQELQALSRWPAPKATVLVSGLLGGFERAPLPAAWRENAVMAQAVDLPDRRRARVDYALGWFRLRRVALVAPQVQADTYLACGLLSEVLNHSADVAVREYVLERFEDMIERRVLTGYYPRLSLGPGQRFASKGGFLVRFAGSEGQKLVADGAWTVP